MSEKLNIEGLFKTKLEDQEITPSSSVWEKTIRTTRRKQFMRFNPRRFNIYYSIGMALIIGGLSYFVADQFSGSEYPTIENQEKETEATGDTATPMSSEDPSVSKIERQTTEQEEPGSKTEEKSISASQTEKQSSQDEDTAESGNVMSEKEDSGNNEGSEAEKSVLPEVKTLVVYFTSSVKEGCAPLEVTFSNQSANGVEYRWLINAELTEITQNPENFRHVFKEQGAYLVSLISLGETGQEKIFTEKIKVHPRPEAEFEIVDDAIYNYSVGATDFKWSVVAKGTESVIFSDELQPDLEQAQSNCLIPDVSCRLFLEAENMHGCTDTMSVSLPATAKPTIEFPNAFSPTGPSGGMYNPNEPNNDIFHPVYSELPVDYTLTIYNKAGELIFRTTDIHTGWDGYHQQAPAAPGVYIWKCAGRWNNGQFFELHGDLTLIRNGKL